MRARLVAVAFVFVAVALLGACRPVPTGGGGTDPDAVTKAELIRALAAEKIAYAPVSMRADSGHLLRPNVVPEVREVPGGGFSSSW